MNDSIEATPITEAEQKRRAEYIAGLRTLADSLEANPEALPLPYDGNATRITFYFLSADDPRARMAAAARALPGGFTKRVTDDDEHAPGTLRLEGRLQGLRIQLVAYRTDVCERVVTGTEDREVEEVVTPAVTRTVVKPVDTVEWRCGSILAPSAPAQVEDAV